MKLAILLLALLTPSCARHGPSQASAKAAATAQGEPYALSLQDGVLTFCDNRGARKLDLKTNREAASSAVCSRSEPNAACSGLPLDVEVRTPLNEPNDIVDLGAASFPLKGRVHDCSASGKLLAVVTGSQVVLIDAAKGSASEISPHGGGRIAIGSGWLAWADASKIHAESVLPH
ncbi:MAG: hypothetical protein IT165_18365 [Bryobacterales bacterium]|nr:hypothetical protein [Bryobacterales bacterium]